MSAKLGVADPRSESAIIDFFMHILFLPVALTTDRAKNVPIFYLLNISRLGFDWPVGLFLRRDMTIEMRMGGLEI
ncbi:hypothetical protein QW180_15710 [Vibrio sinaloensis]|nr:hypothetical protein [Vibrio sinaloensis]